MGVHDEHRKRLKTQFAEHGLDSFADHVVLELLLFYALPRVDTNELAHRLIDHFGGLDGVLEAPAEALAKFPGLGWSSALLLRLMLPISRRYGLIKSRGGQILDSAERAGAYLVPLFAYERDEVALAVCLDSKLQALCHKEISRGVATATDISIRKIVELALSQNASGVLLAHNHISGIAIPSPDDRVTTEQIKNALSPIGIRLVDHIVVAGDDFVSMSDSGMV